MTWSPVHAMRKKSDADRLLGEISHSRALELRLGPRGPMRRAMVNMWKWLEESQLRVILPNIPSSARAQFIQIHTGVSCHIYTI